VLLAAGIELSTPIEFVKHHTKPRERSHVDQQRIGLTIGLTIVTTLGLSTHNCIQLLTMAKKSILSEYPVATKAEAPETSDCKLGAEITNDTFRFHHDYEVVADGDERLAPLMMKAGKHPITIATDGSNWIVNAAGTQCLIKQGTTSVYSTRLEGFKVFRHRVSIKANDEWIEISTLDSTWFEPLRRLLASFPRATEAKSKNDGHLFVRLKYTIGSRQEKAEIKDNKIPDKTRNDILEANEVTPAPTPREPTSPLGRRVSVFFKCSWCLCLMFLL
jgi:hypothetical protein